MLQIECECAIQSQLSKHNLCFVSIKVCLVKPLFYSFHRNMHGLTRPSFKSTVIVKVCEERARLK